MKILQKIIIIFLIWLIFPQTIYAKPVEEIWTKQLDTVDFSSIEQVVNRIKKQSDNSYLEEFDFSETIRKIIKGEIDFSILSVTKVVVKLFFQEIKGFMSLIGKLLIISILCALLNNIAESFQNKSTSQIGFYVCYIVLIILLLQSFQIAMEVSQSTIENMVLIMQSVLPILLTLMMTSGGVSSGTIFEPIILFSVQTISMFVKSIILPTIFLIAVIGVVNSLSGKEVLKKMKELFEQITDWILKGIAALFVGIMGIHGLTAPALDGIINNAAKSAVSTFVPIVGEALSGAVDVVMNCSLLIKNAIGVGAIILLCIYCIIPVIKILSFLFAYKIAAALIEPISDKRIVNCISDMGEACKRLFTCIFTVNILFIVSITILVGVGSMIAMLR
ncbi:MAG: stage sporulation protein [Epulopiscium sp.]|jgi:stage III sporulation protein AE|uniref:Stage III sporulation protein AE n=1 Tax=Defluviitalea raffinosedens TaxID=1450156 RepID=A0A7C8HHC5_9FIRM|nr:stage III sporulation protein AE [Defluviitalea raffinosedens]KAE9637232.1 stage III sporulation protein AE [Defluviitalea raffinosedens]MDK2788699.1 stage sporulation protein [Candidatus Epulonipiscium sp.]